MASTSYGVNDALAVKLWARELAHEAVKATEIYPLIGPNANSVIQEKTETRKGPGDRVTVGLRMQLSGDGFTESEIAEGNGEALTTYADNVFVNELGHVVGVRSENTIDAQRVAFDLREEAKDGLVDWWARRISVAFFNQVAGNTATSGPTFPTSVKYTGLNATIAPSAGRILRFNAAGTALASDEAVQADTTAGLSLATIDKCIELAKTGGSNSLPKIRPIRIEGGEHYVMYIHPINTTQLRAGSSAGQWLDIQKAAMTGGEVTENPIFTGALGMYNNCILRESEQIPYGVGSAASPGVQQTSTRRCVFMGAQAAGICFGMNSGENRYRWNEELYDHKRRLEVSAWSIYGVKKFVFNATDFATIVVSTYGVPAA
jgi:N4-gp56 family major capsid protein